MTTHKIIVSDPWDFEALDGSNVILGVIIKFISPKLIAFQSYSLLKFGNQTGKTLLLKPRYEKQVLDRENGYKGTVGGALLLLEDFGDWDEKHLELNSVYVLIGSLEPVDS